MRTMRHPLYPFHRTPLHTVGELLIAEVLNHNYRIVPYKAQPLLDAAGNGFQFMAGQAAGYAAADAVQALPLVSTIWGELLLYGLIA